MLSKKVVWGNGFLCLAAVLCLSPFAAALDVCGQGFVFIDGSEDPVVDINCETGYTFVYNGATVNLREGAHISENLGGSGGGILTSGGNITINIYAGTIDTMLNTTSTDIVTIYGSSFVLGGDQLSAGQTQIVGPLGTDGNPMLLTGDGTEGPISIPLVLEEGAIVNLNISQTAPDIYVQPAQGIWDFGNVELGQSSTVVVEIYNHGNADLIVYDVQLTGDEAFTIDGVFPTQDNPLIIAPNTSKGVDFEVTFAPASQGYKSATVTIISNDEDEGIVEVSLYGMGIAAEVPPLVQIQNILAYFDASAADGTLLGYGPGNSPDKRLNALRNMIEAADDLIQDGAYDLAIIQLEAIAKKTDGIAKPQDFAVGEAVPVLNAMINDLMAALAS